MALEETAGKGMIPLVFQIDLDGSRMLRRLDTNEVVDEKYVEILRPDFIVEAPHKRCLISWFKSQKYPLGNFPDLLKANAFLYDESTADRTPEGVPYCDANYCIIDEEVSRDADRSAKVWGAFSVE